MSYIHCDRGLCISVCVHIYLYILVVLWHCRRIMACVNTYTVTAASGAGVSAAELSEKEAKKLRKQVRDLKRQKKQAEGAAREELKTQIAVLEQRLREGGAAGGGGETAYRDFVDLSGDGGVKIKMLKAGSGFSPQVRAPTP